MSKKMQEAIREHLTSNGAVIDRTGALVEAYQVARGSSPETSFTRDVEFLIRVGACTNEDAPNNAQEAEAVLSKAIKPVLRLKRSLGFFLGEVFMVANRFGVITFNTTSELPMKNFASLHLTRMRDEIHRHIGAERTHYDGRDNVYQYTK